MQIKIILAIILAVGVFFGAWLIKYQYDTITALKAENKQLKTNWEKEKQNVLEASKRVQKLNEIIASNADVKSWADNPIALPVLNELRKQYLSNKD